MGALSSPVRVAEPQTQTLRLADGTELAADVYRPVGEGRRPLLLMRQPYGKRIGSTVVLAHPSWYAAQGFVVVVQDVRGTGTSGGVFEPFASEASDGAASLAWAADLAGSDGRVGLYGFSYHAGNQFQALAGASAAGSKRPDALVPVMGPFDLVRDLVTEGGALRLAGQLLWACQMAAVRARHAGDAEAEAALTAAARGAPWASERAAHPEVLERYARYSHFCRWRDDPQTLDALSPHTLLADDPLDVPAAFFGGWQDFLLAGTLRAAGAWRGRGRTPPLTIGPWAHIPWSRQLGARDLGPAATPSVDRKIVAFLRHIFFGEDGPSGVELFDVGTCEWARAPAWPQTAPLDLFLGSTGLAAATSSDGQLADAAAADGLDVVVHDPWRPAPAVGGPLGQPGGYADRTAVDDRADVAVYTSRPLERALTILGAAEAELFVETDHPSFDLNVTLAWVAPDGRATSLTQGTLRVDDPAASHTLALRATCATIPQGWSLRVSLQLAAWPAFAINPGTGLRPEDARICDLQVTTARVLHGAKTPSRLRLPIGEG